MQTIFGATGDSPMGLYFPAEARLMLLRCSAVLCHHVSDSIAYKFYFANQTYQHRWSLIAVTELCLYTIYGTRCVRYISNKVCIEVTGASSVRTRLDYCNAILVGTADTVIKRLQSIQKTAARLVSETIFRDLYHYSRQPHLLLMWRRIVSKRTILSLPI